jgi:hypothetical protein
LSKTFSGDEGMNYYKVMVYLIKKKIIVNGELPTGVIAFQILPSIKKRK